MSESIRVACIDDVHCIVDMARAAADEGVFHVSDLSVEEQHRRLREFAFENPQAGYELFVVQIGDRIVGYVDSLVSRGVGRILGIYVKPNHRKNGIGQKLMSKTLDSFQKRKCHKARLEVFADNANAIEFYTHLNFIQEGLLRKDENKRDNIIMSKFLDDDKIE